MRRIHNSVLRLSILACLTAGGLAVSPPASAACTGDTNTCFGTNVLTIATGVGNTGIGYSALNSNTTGYRNTASGSSALRYNTTGYWNTASGSEALLYNTTGYWNTASGAEALRYNTAGLQNTASGTQALGSNTTGSLNTASGSQALNKNTTGSSNTASGRQALYSNTTGHSNAASGVQALYSNIGGTYNTASGMQALYKNTAGTQNTASGSAALYNNTTGNYNTASGNSALFYNTGGSNNTASGRQALYSNTTGINNTGSGYSALYNATTGYRNVALGWQAGFSVTTGSDNIIIGGGNQGTSADAGIIRIGTGTYQKKAFIAGIRGVQTGATGAVAVLIDANGQLGTINSSRRFKEDIQPMGSVSEKLFGLRPVTFRYKQPYDDGSKPVQFGLVAEEVAQVFPELVVNGKDGKPETVSYHLLATLLLNELQKEHRVVEALRRDNESQAARMAALEQQVAVLAKALGPMAKDRLVASAK